MTIASARPKGSLSFQTNYLSLLVVCSLVSIFETIVFFIFISNNTNMDSKKTGFEEVESILQDIGNKIEELIEKGTQVGGEAKDEIEKKIKDLKEKRTTLEAEFQKGKEKVEQLYQEKREELEPNFSESKEHFKEGFKQLLEGVKILLGKK
jgi:chromosome segregation ATPase